MVRVDPGRRSGRQPDQGTFFQIGKEALLDPLGFPEVGLSQVRVRNGLGGRPMVEHCESPQKIDRSIRLRPWRVWKKALVCAFPPDPPSVACYDGTMPPAEINRQCTPAQLWVNPRSTGKSLKERHLQEIEMQTTKVR